MLLFISLPKQNKRYYFSVLAVLDYKQRLLLLLPLLSLIQEVYDTSTCPDNSLPFPPSQVSTTIMDLLQELENLAINAATGTSEDKPPSSACIARWETLFDLNPTSARDNVIQYRANIARPRIPDELWDDIKEAKEKGGYDREAYEYEVFCHSKRPRPSPAKKIVTDDTHIYAVLISGPLDSLEKIEDVAGLSTTPRSGTVVSESDADANAICYIDRRAKQRILDWLSREGSDYKPVFMTFSIARKQLSTFSAYPTLGVDTTFPQNRATNDKAVMEPGQNQYPVWYFFYGTLAEPDRLMRLLELNSLPVLETAHVFGGAIQIWGNKYKALVDGSSLVNGHAFLVESQAQEEALRAYKGSMYEVVRCTINMTGRVVCGLSFRFIHKS